MKNTFAKNLRKYREERKLTQRQLAETAGITATSISSYENQAMSPSLEIVEKLAQSLDVSVVDLISENQFSDINITTYADVMRLLYSISKKIRIIFLPTENDFRKTSLNFCNLDLSNFIDGWAKMQNLVDEKTIEKSLLEYWMQQQFEANEEDIDEADELFFL